MPVSAVVSVCRALLAARYGPTPRVPRSVGGWGVGGWAPALGAGARRGWSGLLFWRSPMVPAAARVAAVAPRCTAGGGGGGGLAFAGARGGG